MADVRNPNNESNRTHSVAALTYAELERKLAIAVEALSYITQPTMGYVGPETPDSFARNIATDKAVRAALSTCITAATTAMERMRVADDGWLSNEQVAAQIERVS